MSRVESSQLAFLFDALRGNPSLAGALLGMEAKADRPGSYKAAVEKLRVALDEGRFDTELEALRQRLL